MKDFSTTKAFIGSESIPNFLERMRLECQSKAIKMAQLELDNWSEQTESFMRDTYKMSPQKINEYKKSKLELLQNN